MKFDTWEETFESVRDILAKETQCHEELLTSEKCDKYDRQKYEDLASGNVNEVRLSAALQDLSDMRIVIMELRRSLLLMSMIHRFSRGI